jgi:hypothetical protein
MSLEQAMESFLAGPVPSAVPQIQMLGIERLPNGRLRFRVQTNTPQRVHRLHSAPDVTGEWSEESAPLNPAGAGLLETEIDPPVSHRFYRVVLP